MRNCFTFCTCRLPLTTTLPSLLPLQFVPSIPNFPQTSIFKVYYNFNYATPTPLIKTNTKAFISKLQNNLTALLNFHLTLPLYNLPFNNNEKHLHAITWNSCIFRNKETQQSSAVTFLERSNGHRHQLFCHGLTLQSHVCRRSILFDCHIFGISYITLHYGWLSSRTVGKHTVHTQKLHFSALRNMFKTTESYRGPLSPTAVVYQQPPYGLRNTPLYRAVTEIHHGYRVAMALCQFRNEA